ncbi:MAG TPA: rhomboid family intramembrane serine protease [Pyrinomonadaceae bacterium]|jgi:membrane associated rhomboid family serine protease|nr:rhomboid family intramembrane serine protease [Pyrinomonadaceae bacterium]
MIFPIGDDNSDRTTTPYVNYLLLAANILVFVFFQGLGSNERFTYAWATVPQEIVTGRDIARPVVVEDPISGDPVGRIPLQPTPGSVYLTLLVSMFMHGGFAHLFGNMLYLWIFGDNLEDRMGHVRYLIFYLLCGVLASLAHVVTNTGSYIPSLGASGAISGVLGGYLLLFPSRRVHAIAMRFFVTEVPAWVAIGLWFVFQLINGLGMLGGGSQAGGVAYAAHIGGFIAGLVLVKLFAAGRPGPGPRAAFGRY